MEILSQLGTCGDIVGPSGNKIKFDFEFVNQKESLEFEFFPERSERNLNLKQYPKNFSIDSCNSIARLQFISAVRGGISDTSPIPNDIDYFKEGVGIDGRFAGYWFDQFSENEIELTRRFDNKEGDSLETQVNAWLDFIAPGTNANVRNFDKKSVIALEFKLSKIGEWRSPANVGFGISYVFPIIVALLTAENGDCIVIDSPEAHLHPRAQSRVGLMLSRFASAGIQIIVETHSDHILNGVRIAVKRKHLKPEDLSILFFAGASPSEHGVISTPIDSQGRIEHWPEGFF